MDDPPRPGCPKRMVFGPCGGVRADGGCEVDGIPCVFVATATPAWSGPTRRPPSDPSGVPTGGAAPWVVTDLHGRPRHLGSLRAVAARLRGSCDAVLVGDHGGRRNDFPPSFTAGVVMAEGLAPWVTLSCRDRNRVALAAECAALAEMGVAGVHCVTGDWQGSGGGVGETKVFDLDALRLVDLARDHGLVVSVAAAPAAPPTDRRAARLAEKVRAGAQACFVNHAGGPGPTGRFVASARQLGVEIPFLPCVPVVSDPASVRALASLPGLAIDPAVVTSVAARGGERTAGIEAAEAEAALMLGIPGVVGVNLSGAASSVSELDSADMMADLGRRIRPDRDATR